MKKKLLLTIIVFLVAYIEMLQAQITHDNNTINSADNPLSITVPIGSNKALVVIPAAGDASNYTFDPFNGQNGRVLISSESLSMYMFSLGDVTTEFTTNLSYAESGRTLTVFTINNVDQTVDPVVQPTNQAAGEFVIPHHGGFDKKAGDMALTAFSVEQYTANFNPTPFSVTNSENNTVNSEYQFIVANNIGAPYFAHYSSIISAPDEYTLWFLDNPLSGGGSSGISFDCRKIGIILRSLDDPLLSIPEQDVKVFKVYPNPTTSSLHFNQPIKGRYNIYNMLGQEVLTSRKSKKIKEIDISELQIGTYLIKINTSDGKILEKQFVIK